MQKNSMGNNCGISLDFAKRFNQSMEYSQKGREIKRILFLKYFTGEACKISYLFQSD